eukprot:COSAG02_NODE_6954_length_3265_cov_1.750790_2_plen_40_part_00
MARGGGSAFGTLVCHSFYRVVWAVLARAWLVFGLESVCC